MHVYIYFVLWKYEVFLVGFGLVFPMEVTLSYGGYDYCPAGVFNKFSGSLTLSAHKDVHPPFCQLRGILRGTVTVYFTFIQ